MKDTDQIIALAEWLGWIFEPGNSVTMFPDRWKGPVPGQLQLQAPDFPNSLDALKPAIEKMTEAGWSFQLGYSVERKDWYVLFNREAELHYSLSATPELAIMEAILKANNLWREE